MSRSSPLSKSPLRSRSPTEFAAQSELDAIWKQRNSNATSFDNSPVVAIFANVTAPISDPKNNS